LLGCIAGGIAGYYCFVRDLNGINDQLGRFSSRSCLPRRLWMLSRQMGRPRKNIIAGEKGFVAPCLPHMQGQKWLAISGIGRRKRYR